MGTHATVTVSALLAKTLASATLDSTVNSVRRGVRKVTGKYAVAMGPVTMVLRAPGLARAQMDI